MFTDSKGIKRLKIGLHTHTTRSDGKKTPEEAAKIYAAAGYDAVALTDHWKYGEAQELCGLKILSGCEYNVGGGDARDAVYHIVGFGMERDPGLTRRQTSSSMPFTPLAAVPCWRIPRGASTPPSSAWR